VVIAFIREFGYRKSLCKFGAENTKKAQNNICAELLQHGVNDKDADNKTINGMTS
jgi:hypothetical protein